MVSAKKKKTTSRKQKFHDRHPVVTGILVGGGLAAIIALGFGAHYLMNDTAAVYEQPRIDVMQAIEATRTAVAMSSASTPTPTIRPTATPAPTQQPVLVPSPTPTPDLKPVGESNAPLANGGDTIISNNVRYVPLVSQNPATTTYEQSVSGTVKDEVYVTRVSGAEKLTRPFTFTASMEFSVSTNVVNDPRFLYLNFKNVSLDPVAAGYVLGLAKQNTPGITADEFEKILQEYGKDGFSPKPVPEDKTAEAVKKDNEMAASVDEALSKLISYAITRNIFNQSSTGLESGMPTINGTTPDEASQHIQFSGFEISMPVAVSGYNFSMNNGGNKKWITPDDNAGHPTPGDILAFLANEYSTPMNYATPDENWRFDITLSSLAGHRFRHSQMYDGMNLPNPPQNSNKITDVSVKDYTNIVHKGVSVAFFEGLEHYIDSQTLEKYALKGGQATYTIYVVPDSNGDGKITDEEMMRWIMLYSSVKAMGSTFSIPYGNKEMKVSQTSPGVYTLSIPDNNDKVDATLVFNDGGGQ